MKLFSSKNFYFSAAAALIIKVASVVVVYLMSISLARSLGAQESGYVFYGITLVVLFSAIGRFGLDNTLVRFSAAEKSLENEAAVKYIHRLATKWSISLSLLLVALALICLFVVNNYFESKSVFGPDIMVYVIFAIAIPFYSIFNLDGQSIKGIGHVSIAVAIINFFLPALFLIFILFFGIESAFDGAFFYLIAIFLTFLISRYLYFTKISKGVVESPVEHSVILNSCVPLWTVAILSHIGQWSGQLILGVTDTSTEVALFSSAQRTALLTSFVLMAINAVAAPKFSVFYRQKKIDQLRALVRQSVQVTLLVGVISLCVILVFSKELLAFFGPEFVSASTPLIILAFGQFINLATGSVAFLLSMTGGERELRLNLIIGASIGLILGLILIPAFGILGAAISTAVSVATKNILGVYQVWKRLRINTLKFW